MTPAPIRALALAAAVLVGACGGGAESAKRHVAEGKALGAQGKHEAAVAELRKATELDPHSTEAWLELGHAQQALKNHDAALAAYVAAKRADRLAVAPYLAHARVQIELGRVEQAILELTLVTEMDPKNLEALLLQGRVSQLPRTLPDGTTGVPRESLERAELNLQAALELAPQNVEAQLDLARVQGRLGKREQALAALARLEALAATDAAAKQLLPEVAKARKELGA